MEALFSRLKGHLHTLQFVDLFLLHIASQEAMFDKCYPDLWLKGPFNILKLVIVTGVGCLAVILWRGKG